MNIVQYSFLKCLDIWKGSGEVIWPHSHYIFSECLTGLV